MRVKWLVDVLTLKKNRLIKRAFRRAEWKKTRGHNDVVEARWSWYGNLR